VSLGGGPKPHLACAPKGRRTPFPLGALRVCSRPLPRLIPGGSCHQRRGGLPHTATRRGHVNPRRFNHLKPVTNAGWAEVGRLLVGGGWSWWELLAGGSWGTRRCWRGRSARGKSNTRNRSTSERCIVNR